MNDVRFMELEDLAFDVFDEGDAVVEFNTPAEIWFENVAGKIHAAIRRQYKKDDLLFAITSVVCRLALILEVNRIMWSAGSGHMTRIG